MIISKFLISHALEESYS